VSFQSVRLIFWFSFEKTPEGRSNLFIGNLPSPKNPLLPFSPPNVAASGRGPFWDYQSFYEILNGFKTEVPSFKPVSRVRGFAAIFGAPTVKNVRSKFILHLARVKR
jgi:hypothetical protein